MMILEPLSAPIVEGLDAITLMRYPFPDVVLEGIVALILPLPVDVSVPIVTGVANEPEASLNWAVKILPVEKEVHPIV
jgi:hypothetical protein